MTGEAEAYFDGLVLSSKGTDDVSASGLDVVEGLVGALQ